MEAISTTLHYLKGASIKGDKTILQVSELQSPLLPPKLWCNWSCSGFGMRALLGLQKQRERERLEIYVALRHPRIVPTFIGNLIPFYLPRRTDGVGQNG